MKRLTGWILLAAMLFAVFAASAEKPYAAVIPASQSDIPYNGVTLISRESYPGPCLTTLGDLHHFVMFDPPENAVVDQFAPDAVKYIRRGDKPYNTLMITYSLIAGYGSPAKYVAEKQPRQVISETETSAAFIGDWGIACGYIALPEMGNTVALVVSIDGDGAAEFLAEEMERFLSPGTIRVEEILPYWSYGMFAGARITDYMDGEYTLQFDFPSLGELGMDSQQADFAVSKLYTTNIFQGYYFPDRGSWIAVTVRLDGWEPDFSEHEGAYEVQTSSGAVWTVAQASHSAREDAYDEVDLFRALPAGKAGNNRYIVISILSSDWDEYTWTKEMIGRIPEMLDGKITVTGASNP